MRVEQMELFYHAEPFDVACNLAGNPLDVKDHLDKPPVLETLCQIWVRLAKWLREANLAHCDLQHGNVLLVPGSKAGSLAVNGRRPARHSYATRPSACRSLRLSAVSPRACSGEM